MEQSTKIWELINSHKRCADIKNSIKANEKLATEFLETSQHYQTLFNEFAVDSVGKLIAHGNYIAFVRNGLKYFVKYQNEQLVLVIG